MAKVKYLGEADGNKETSQFGYDFKDGKAVEVTNPDHIVKFKGNPFFEVEGDEPKLPVRGGTKD